VDGRLLTERKTVRHELTIHKKEVHAAEKSRAGKGVRSPIGRFLNLTSAQLIPRKCRFRTVATSGDWNGDRS
jgi:hypothetical protein